MVTSSPVAIQPRAHRAERADHRTLLVNMPFSMSTRPSLGLGILASAGRQAGFTVETLHASVDFHQAVGAVLFNAVANVRRELLGEWLFSVAAFGDQAPDRDGSAMTRLLIDSHAPEENEDDGLDLQELIRVRDHVLPTFLDTLADEILAQHWDLIGFSSTFQQTTPSIALARLLRRRNPQLRFVFGGANFDGPMGIELHRAIDEIDLVVQGEADHAFSRLLMFERGELEPHAVPGLIWVDETGAQRINPGQPIEDMDTVAVPTFDEFFERRKDVMGVEPIPGHSSIPIETARGCWWGAKKHCTFCGLNAETMEFRSKSPERALEELTYLADRHQVTDFAVADNIIDPGYAETVFPELDRRELDYNLFFEIKSSLTIDDLRTMRDGGVVTVQPGIESLSSKVLRLMDKGEKGITGVNLLRWAQVFDVHVFWNLLYGFVGENEQDYVEQAELFAKLVHLVPPEAFGRIWMERFSPMFTQPDRFPVTFRRPVAGYPLSFPDHVDCEEIAYFFDYEFVEHLDDTVYEPLKKEFTAWRELWSSGAPRPTLIRYRSASGSQIVDKRFDGDARIYYLEGCAHDLYDAVFEKPKSLRTLIQELGDSYREKQITHTLDAMVSGGVMMRDGNLFLALALPPRERRGKSQGAL